MKKKRKKRDNDEIITILKNENDELNTLLTQNERIFQFPGLLPTADAQQGRGAGGVRRVQRRALRSAGVDGAAGHLPGVVRPRRRPHRIRAQQNGRSRQRGHRLPRGGRRRQQRTDVAGAGVGDVGRRQVQHARGCRRC